MPSAPHKSCSAFPCPNPATYRGRCAAHARKAGSQRWSENDGAYNGPWRKLSVLAKAEEPLCRWCRALGLVESTMQVDHIIPIAERPDLRLFRANLMGLCLNHHGLKTSDEIAGRIAQPFVQRQRLGVLQAIENEQHG